MIYRHHLQQRHDRLVARPGTGGDPDRQLRLHADQSVRYHHGEVHLRRCRHLQCGLGGGPVHRQPAPTFFIGSTTFTLDTVNLVVTDSNRRPYPLIANPTMFSINGFNYLIDTNQIPHAIVGNDNVSPLQTDITVQNGQPIANSTFTLNGQIYAYTEDASTIC